MTFPKFYRIKQSFDATFIEDVAGSVREKFAAFDIGENVLPGQTVAVTVGSRGIHNLKVLVATVVECLKERGLKPYIIFNTAPLPVWSSTTKTSTDKSC